MNDIIKAMEERRSIRKFKPEMPPKSDIGQIIEAGLYAASARGEQSAIIVAVTNKELRDRISADNCKIGGWENFDPFYGAPVILIVLANKNWANRVYDGSLVMGNLMNAAHALGVASCWIHRAKEEFDSEEGKAILKSLGIEGDYEGIGHCVLGYAASEIKPAAPRKANWTYRI